MALVDRVVEYPGRVRLTPVPGEENVYDMSREEGEVTIWGTELNAENLYDGLGHVYEDYTGTVTYEAGTIGTRATAVNMGMATRAGYRLVSLLILSATNASAYSIQPYVSSGTVYAAIYRATTAAVSGASITIRAVWLPLTE